MAGAGANAASVRASSAPIRFRVRPPSNRFHRIAGPKLHARLSLSRMLDVPSNANAPLNENRG